MCHVEDKPRSTKIYHPQAQNAVCLVLFSICRRLLYSLCFGAGHLEQPDHSYLSQYTDYNAHDGEGHFYLIVQYAELRRKVFELLHCSTIVCYRAVCHYIIIILS